ncbi:MAG: hypothetical protein JW954_03030 [Dehalococcoidaceae bacterium]|nr:hypothetical protein [Dehalococcoidaceae bacterium]
MNNQTFPKLLVIIFILAGQLLLNGCTAGVMVEIDAGLNPDGAGAETLCPVPTELARVPGSEVGVGVDHEAVPLFPGTVRIDFIEAPE